VLVPHRRRAGRGVGRAGRRPRGRVPARGISRSAGGVGLRAVGQERRSAALPVVARGSCPERALSSLSAEADRTSCGPTLARYPRRA
jgi:hypothetical protein